MNLKDYQSKARSTAIYLDIERTKMLYPALGLIGECGEISEKIKKLIRDNNNEMSKDRALAIAKELGDCCWYLANICCDTGTDLEMIHDMRGAHIVQEIRRLSIPQLVFHLNYHTTMVAQELKEWYYEYDGNLSRANLFRDIPNHLSQIITCIQEIANICNFTLEEICQMNIEKLAGRKSRGTLHGDGDQR